MSKQARQITVQDEYPLVMDGARQLDFALNIEKALFSSIGTGRDAHRKAKPVISQIDNGKPVDLRHLFARHDQQTLAIDNGFLQTLFRVVVTMNARQSGVVHIHGVHFGVATLPGQRCAFDHQGLGQCKNRTLASLVLRSAVRVFDQCRDSRG